MLCNGNAEQPAIECLQCLAVVNQVPLHRNQQQILRSLISNRGACMRGVAQLPTLLPSTRASLLEMIKLVCTCCVGNHTEVQALAQSLVPLPMLLRLMADMPGLELMPEQVAVGPPALCQAVA